MSGPICPLNNEVKGLSLHQVKLFVKVIAQADFMFVGNFIALHELKEVAPCKGVEGVLGLFAGYHQYTLMLIGI